MGFKKKFSSEDNLDIVDIEDPENYRGGVELKFSHEMLVMEQYRRIQKSLSQEMKKGYEETKQDRTGNILSVKHYPDTRKEAGESIETLKNIMIGDVKADKITKESMPELFNELKELEKKYVKLEQDAWDSIPPHYKKPNSG